MLNNRYSAYKTPGVSVFWAERLSNRAWMEQLIETLLPCGDAVTYKDFTGTFIFSDSNR
jgi:hypothetical protein